MIRKFDGDWNYRGCTIRFRGAPLVEIFTRYFIYRDGHLIEAIDLQGGNTDLNQDEVKESIDSYMKRKKIA